MHGDGLDERLEDLHRRQAGDHRSEEHRRRLQTELQARYRQRFPRNRRWLMLLNPYDRIGRFAMAGLALLILGVGACSTSTTSVVEMGQQVKIDLASKSAALPEIDAALQGFLATVPGIENVNLNIQEEVGGPVVLDLMLWGQDLSGEQLVADLRREIPALADAAITAEPMTGTIQESLVDKWARDVFQLEIDGATEEEIRAQIMEQLLAQGADDAQVEVLMEDGRTEIKVMVTEDVPE